MTVFFLALSPAVRADPAGALEPDEPGTASPAAGTAFELISYDSKGETVVRVQLRLRELGYFHYKPTGNFQSMSVEATKKFQQKQTGSDGSPIIADGTVGAQTLSIIFGRGVTRADIDVSIPFGPALSGPASRTGELADWGEVKELLSPNASFTVYDFNTGASWKMVFTGGENHAEVECASAEDTYAYREAFGAAFNFSKRPVVAEIGGRLIAASLQGAPHGEDKISGNEMPGHACLFFNGSLSHVGSLPDVEHQALVYKASGRVS